MSALGRVARPAGRGGARAVALVESPLQLLMTVEAVHGGHAPRPLVVHVRRDVPGLAETARAFARLDLPDGVVLAARGPLSTGAAGLRGGPVVLGDAFSGRAQSLLVARDRAAVGGGTPQEVVVVDDGLATAHLARVLAARERLPLVRPGAAGSPRRDALGLSARDALLHHAADGALTLVTAFEPPHDVRRGLDRAGVRVVPATLRWAARQVPSAADRAVREPVVVVGSALVPDGLLRPEPYLAWLHAHAARGAVRYLPHRRERAADLARVASVPGVVVDRAGLPVELRLAALRPPQRVVALPTSALALLPAVLAPGVTLDATVPDADWWEPGVTAELRAHLVSVVSAASRRG